MIPEKMHFGRIKEFDIGLYLNHAEKFELEDRCDSISRFVCGYPVPSKLQRELCWSSDQKVTYIESIWLDFPLDPICIHAEDWNTDNTPKPFSGWVLDGQNRLNAIESYVNGEFPVYGLFYFDLTPHYKRRFRNTKLALIEVEFWNFDKIKDFFLRKAYGGTAHTV